MREREGERERGRERDKKKIDRTTFQLPPLPLPSCYCKVASFIREGLPSWPYPSVPGVRGRNPLAPGTGAFFFKVVLSILYW